MKDFAGQNICAGDVIAFAEFGDCLCKATISAICAGLPQLIEIMYFDFNGALHKKLLHPSQVVKIPNTESFKGNILPDISVYGVSDMGVAQ